MTDEPDHAHCVEAWWKRVAADRSAAASLRALEGGFGAVWARANDTLGDITLMAIGDRVLHDAAEQHPLLAALRLEPAGLSCEELARDAHSLDPAELEAAVKLVLVQLLTVVGRLTGEVLTPFLHAALEADREGADLESRQESEP